jgi:biopolymer transport protein ExbD
VIVREGGLELTNGTSVIAKIPKVEDTYDLATLSELIQSLKRDHPDEQDASVLLEPEIEYDHLIQVMDAVRSAELPQPDGEGVTRVALFTELSIGDAP